MDKNDIRIAKNLTFTISSFLADSTWVPPEEKNLAAQLREKLERRLLEELEELKELEELEELPEELPEDEELPKEKVERKKRPQGFA